MNTTGQIITCKAAVAWEPKKPMVIEEIQVAPPQDNEVRIKIVATSMCHSDLYRLYEGMFDGGFPIILGHEAAGIVESVGPGVTEFKPGDKVIPLSLAQCGQCFLCKNPKINLCEKDLLESNRKLMTRTGSRFSCKGKEILMFMGTGTFSEYTVVKQYRLVKIHPDAPLDKVCLLGCGIISGYGAAVNIAEVYEGSTCAVFGLGAVGLAAVMGCKAAGAERILAVDTNPEKFEKAKILGATDVVNPKDHSKPIHEVLREMTGRGVNIALECVGKAAVVESALHSTVLAGGVCVIVGFTDMEKFSLRPSDFIPKRSLLGAAFGGCKSKDGVTKLLELYMDKKLKVDEFITHNMHLDQIMEAADLMQRSKCVRVVLKASP